MDLDITARASQTLHTLGARTIDDVARLTRGEIAAAGCRPRDIASIVAALLAEGRRLRRKPRTTSPGRRRSGPSGASPRVVGDELAAQRAAILGALGAAAWPGAVVAGLLLGVSPQRVGQAWAGARVRPETIARWMAHRTKQ